MEEISFSEGSSSISEILVLMPESNSFFKVLRKSSGFRLSVLFGSFFFLLLLSSILSLGLNELKIGSPRDHALIGSAIQAIFVFCLPAVILARFSSDNWSGWLDLKTKPPVMALIGVLIVYVISMPAMEWLIEFNKNIHLPEALEGIEKTMRDWEENSEHTTEILLSSTGIVSMLIGVFVIGILTGFSEELFFRGGLQGIFVRSSMKVGAAVLLTAFTFSFMHFQFFGFFPRLIMGVFFGYLLIWTRSIWVPVFAHVLNNSFVVVTAYLLERTDQSSGDFNLLPFTSDNIIGVLASIVITVLFFMFCKDLFFKQSMKKWLKSQLPPVSEK